MSRIVRTLEALQDAISRVPKVGSAWAIYEKELIEVLSDALNTIKWLTDEGPAITEPKPGVRYEYGVLRTDKNAGEKPTPQVSKEAARRTIQRQQNAPRGYRITGQKIMRRLVSEWEPSND